MISKRWVDLTGLSSTRTKAMCRSSGRPPVAGAAVHLLLGHEFRHAVLDRTAAVRGQRAFGAAGKAYTYKFWSRMYATSRRAARSSHPSRPSPAGVIASSAWARGLGEIVVIDAGRPSGKSSACPEGANEYSNIPERAAVLLASRRRRSPPPTARLSRARRDPESTKMRASARRAGRIPTDRGGPCRPPCLAGRSPARHRAICAAR